MAIQTRDVFYVTDNSYLNKSKDSTCQTHGIIQLLELIRNWSTIRKEKSPKMQKSPSPRRTAFHWSNY